MANYLNLDKPNRVYVRRAIDLYNKALSQFKGARILSEQRLLQEFYRAVFTFFSSLGKPKVQRNMALVHGTNPDPDKYNDFLEAVHSDMNTAFDQQNALERSVLSNYNVLQTQRERLDTDLKTLRHLTANYTVFSRSPSQLEIWFQEKFNSLENIDLDFPLDNPLTAIDIEQGVSMLKLANTEAAWTSIEDFDSIRIFHDFMIESNPFEPDDDPTRPQRWSNQSRARVVEPRDWYQGKMYGIFPFSAGDDDGFRIDTTDVSVISNPVANLVDQETVERINSFWEFEVVLLEGEIVPHTAGMGSEQTRDHPFIGTIITQEAGTHRSVRRLDKGLDEIFVESIPPTQGQDLVRAKIPQDIFFRNQETVHAWAWSQNPKLIEGFEYDLSIVMSLGETKRMNNLALTPHTFGSSAYPTLKGIYTSSPVDVTQEHEDTDTTWEPLPQFAGNPAPRVLQGSAFNPVSDTDVEVIGTTFKWNFPSRDVKQIKIDFKQDRGYRIKYSVALFGKHWKMEKIHHRVWRSNPKWHFTIDRWVFVDVGGRNLMHGAAEIAAQATSEETLQQLIQDTARTAQVSSIVAENSVESAIGTFITRMGNLIGDTLGLSYRTYRDNRGDDIEHNAQGSYADAQPVGEWDDSGSDNDGYYDIPTERSNRWRFAIGLRDISSGAHVFAETSEGVSQPYFSPQPIKKIALDVDEVVPSLFREINADGVWFRYYVSVDNGATFYRINPADAKDIFFEDGYAIPKIITINSDLPVERRRALAYGEHGFIDTERPVYEIRFKWVILRPAGTEGTGLDNPAISSPMLNGYALRITPKTSLFTGKATIPFRDKVRGTV